MSQLGQLLRNKKIVVCCGSGGVGKTTTAAALAMAAAADGAKVLVCTIDPAKRLANSLGLSELGNDARQVAPEKFQAAGVQITGSLWAMMLDTKRTFDELVDRYAPSRETAEDIKDNLLYQNISSALAGSQEYMAMEKLHELHRAGAYDLIVLDTPPTRHALDFLDAPKRVTEFLDGSILQWFITPYFGVAGAGLRVMQRGTRTVLGALERVTGLSALKAISDFFISFEGMYDGFRERAAAVSKILRSRATTFLLVTSPEDLTIDETLFFYEKLKEYRMPFAGFVVNRVHPDYLAGRKMKQLHGRWHAEGAGQAVVERYAGNEAERNAFAKLVPLLEQNFDSFQQLAEADAGSVARLESVVEGREFVLRIPYFTQDIYDIGGLALMNEYLLPTAPPRTSAATRRGSSHGQG